MPVIITAGDIDRDEVWVTLNIKMTLKDWKKFYQELPVLPISTQVKDGLQTVFQQIK